jgi:hypothetical protein
MGQYRCGIQKFDKRARPSVKKQERGPTLAPRTLVNKAMKLLSLYRALKMHEAVELFLDFEPIVFKAPVPHKVTQNLIIRTAAPSGVERQDRPSGGIQAPVKVFDVLFGVLNPKRLHNHAASEPAGIGVSNLISCPGYRGCLPWH